MATTKRIKTAAQVWTAQSRDDVAAAIGDIGKLSRDIDVLTARMNDEIAAITEKYQPEIDRIRNDLFPLQAGIQTWCEAHRAELTQAGKIKTANLITGQVSWRIRPPSVSIRGTGAVLELLKSKGLERFVRTKEEPNKEAMLADPDAVRTIPGISIVSGIEDFVIEPFEQDVR